ncbi:hypothetical protein [Phyllobacterium endophyticum]|nr:hypothetical protein [Phyllobacterium endophyticum]MBB3234336.1 hypothetical protein [Phyllobacterium endophyticum]TYR44071.1 hypothetical protein FY050_02575 [Phyllobacterium endophyticum]
MRHPDMTDKISSKRRGDAVNVLRRNDDGSDENWVQATVVSNFESVITVEYSDGVKEVIPWVSGRIGVDVAGRAG